MSNHFISYAAQLDKVMQGTFIPYKGYVIVREGEDRFKVFDTTCRTLKAAQGKVDNSFATLDQTIRNN